MTTQEKFERQYAKQGFDMTRAADGNNYADSNTQSAWQRFQAIAGLTLEQIKEQGL